ncbi:hypothetical protein G7Y89_g8955 [Cudoniella acicularis]|uniref:Uncharacterized protein n=1 Tax=Cudoniella acicularis TaxID=354080 RepID=A0A8H4RFL5_9HELO|nr:hypothetical protein G7Y89_g8955 [Cudoniella acicularis]
MVQRATPNESRAWSALPSKNEMAIRRISSVFLMAGLLTVIYPFAPFSWLVPSDGVDILDSFVSPPLFLGALFFQWRIAGVVGNLVISVLDNSVAFLLPTPIMLANHTRVLCNQFSSGHPSPF